MSSLLGSPALKKGMHHPGDIVEIGLLLPANRADALVELSRRRHQSVSQFLRGLIDNALTDDVTSGP